MDGAMQVREEREFSGWEREEVEARTTLRRAKKYNHKKRKICVCIGAFLKTQRHKNINYDMLKYIFCVLS